MSLTLIALLATARRTSPFDEARPALDEERGDRDAGVEFGGGDIDGRQRLGDRAFLEGAARRLRRFVGGGAAVEEGGRFGGEHLLGLVDLGAFEAFEAGDLVERQFGEQLQEAADVAVLGVPPELPVLVGRAASSALSQTAPCAVLPILAPDEVVMSGTGQGVELRRAPCAGRARCR